ncbi:unnamed protein product [Cunninghamella blakesleeana]
MKHCNVVIVEKIWNRDSMANLNILHLPIMQFLKLPVPSNAFTTVDTAATVVGSAKFYDIGMKYINAAANNMKKMINNISKQQQQQ